MFHNRLRISANGRQVAIVETEPAGVHLLRWQDGVSLPDLRIAYATIPGHGPLFSVAPITDSGRVCLVFLAPPTDFYLLSLDGTQVASTRYAMPSATADNVPFVTISPDGAALISFDIKNQLIAYAGLQVRGTQFIVTPRYTTPSANHFFYNWHGASMVCLDGTVFSPTGVQPRHFNLVISASPGATALYEDSASPHSKDYLFGQPLHDEWVVAPPAPLWKLPPAPVTKMHAGCSSADGRAVLFLQEDYIGPQFSLSRLLAKKQAIFAVYTYPGLVRARLPLNEQHVLGGNGSITFGTAQYRILHYALSPDGHHAFFDTSTRTINVKHCFMRGSRAGLNWDTETRRHRKICVTVQLPSSGYSSFSHKKSRQSAI